MRATTVVMTVQPFGCSRDGSSENRVLRTNNIYTHNKRVTGVGGGGVISIELLESRFRPNPFFPRNMIMMRVSE
jgi:hypothetical protein